MNLRGHSENSMFRYWQLEHDDTGKRGWLGQATRTASAVPTVTVKQIMPVITAVRTAVPVSFSMKTTLNRLKFKPE